MVNKGDTIKRLQKETGAKIQVEKEKIPGREERYVYIGGTNDQYLHAKQLVFEIVEEWRRRKSQKESFRTPITTERIEKVQVPEYLVPSLFKKQIKEDLHPYQAPNMINILDYLTKKHCVKIQLSDYPNYQTNLRVISIGGRSK